MTAVSFSMSRGVDGFKMSDVTVGALAPSAAFDVELRFQVLDNQGHNLNDAALVRAVDAFRRWLLIGGGATGGNNYTSVTQQPSGPPE